MASFAKKESVKGINDMKTQEKMRKPVLEAKYLNVENADRYRPIIRLFYLEYEKLNSARVFLVILLGEVRYRALKFQNIISVY